VDVPTRDGPVRMHNVFPRLSGTPGEIRWAGGTLGQDNEPVYCQLGVTCAEQKDLQALGAI
jgi:crotonobetainyl-CoA:carnitine CoA-transferase CaiB-like acyl-CoA transferase